MANVTHEFPQWKTVYHYFRLWRLKGIWEHINTVLRTELRIEYDREPVPSAVILTVNPLKLQKHLEYAAMMQTRKSKEESATFSWTQQGCC